MKNKQPDKALPVVDASFANEPGDYDLRMLHGRILRDQRKFPAAAQDFYRAAQGKPDSVEAWSELAGALVLAENYAPALGALDRSRRSTAKSRDTCTCAPSCSTRFTNRSLRSKATGASSP